MNGGTKYIEVEPGVYNYVQDWGEGRPLLLIHGWPLSHRMFDAQAAELPKRGIRVITYDLRGFGKSSKTWDGLDYDTWANDVGKIIAALDLSDVTLGGFSMGGAIAMHYVATKSDWRVSRLALCAAAGPSFTARDGFAQGVPRETVQGIIDLEKTDPAKSKREFGKLFFSTPVSDELAKFYDDIGMQAPPHSTIRGMEELRDRDLREELGNIGIPTRIFHGVNDKVVPFALGEFQRDNIKGSTLVKFDKGGHAFAYEEMDKFNDEMARFVKEAAGGKEEMAARARA